MSLHKTVTPLSMGRTKRHHSFIPPSILFGLIADTENATCNFCACSIFCAYFYSGYRGPPSCSIPCTKRVPPVRYSFLKREFLLSGIAFSKRVPLVRNSFLKREFLLSGIAFSKESSSVRYSFLKREFLLSGIAFSKEGSSCQV